MLASEIAPSSGFYGNLTQLIAVFFQWVLVYHTWGSTSHTAIVLHDMYANYVTFRSDYKQRYARELLDDRWFRICHALYVGFLVYEARPFAAEYRAARYITNILPLMIASVELDHYVTCRDQLRLELTLPAYELPPAVTTQPHPPAPPQDLQETH